MRSALALQTLGSLSPYSVSHPALTLATNGWLAEEQISVSPPVPSPSPPVSFVGTGGAPRVFPALPTRQPLPQQLDLRIHAEMPDGVRAAVHAALELDSADMYDALAAIIGEELEVIRRGG